MLALLKDGKSLTEVTNIVFEKAKTIDGSSQTFNSYYQRLNRLSDTFKTKNKMRSTQERKKYVDKLETENLSFQFSSQTQLQVHQRTLIANSTTRNSYM